MQGRLTIVISIHAPRTGSDTGIDFSAAGLKAFQSTLPARGATDAVSMQEAIQPFSIHASPHGERHAVDSSKTFVKQRLTIHASSHGGAIK